jgi:hypothetical protein
MRNFDYPQPMEGSFVKSHLSQIEQNARRLRGRLQDNDNLPAWVNSKISTSADRLQSASNYMNYKIDTYAGDCESCAKTNPLTTKQSVGAVAVGVLGGAAINHFMESAGAQRMFADSDNPQKTQTRVLIGSIAVFYTIGVILGSKA